MNQEFIPLENLTSTSENGVTRIIWELPSEGRYNSVYYCPIIDNGAKPRVNYESLIIHRLILDHEGVDVSSSKKCTRGITYERYFVFLYNRDEYSLCPKKEQIEQLINNPRFIVKVAFGSVNVSFIKKSESLKNGCYMHNLTITSDSKVPHGMLLYSASSLGHEFSVPFPGDIPQGESVFEPFYTFSLRPGDSNISLISAPGLESQFNITETAKTEIEPSNTSIFKYLFKR